MSIGKTFFLLTCTKKSNLKLFLVQETAKEKQNWAKVVQPGNPEKAHLAKYLAALRAGIFPQLKTLIAGFWFLLIAVRQTAVADNFPSNLPIPSYVDAEMGGNENILHGSMLVFIVFIVLSSCWFEVFTGTQPEREEKVSLELSEEILQSMEVGMAFKDYVSSL